MTPEQIQEYDRLKAMVIRRLQTAGLEGIDARNFGNMLHAEFEERTAAACRTLLIRMANDGKIFRKAVAMDTGGIQSHYFLTAEFCDAYTKNLIEKTFNQGSGVAVKTIPKFEVVEHRELDGIDLGPNVKFKPGVMVQVCRPYDGDYRIKVDSSYVGSFTKEWQEKRQAA